MARFIALNMAGMEPPDIIETLDYETILEEVKDDCSARMAELGLDFDVRDLESDPAVKILEAVVAREIVLRARVNGAAKALLLALAQKNDLEHLGNWFGVERAIVTEASTSGGDDAIMEDDERLRARIQLAPQAFSTAGPYGAYEYIVLTAEPSVQSVAVTVPEPGHVNIYPLVDEGDGTPSPEVLRTIKLALMADDVRPLTDIVSVGAPKVEHINIDVTLVMRQGPDQSVVATAAKTALQAYADACHTVGSGLYRSGIYAAAQVTAVDHVIINEPTDDIDLGDHGCTYVDDIFVSIRTLNPTSQVGR